MTYENEKVKNSTVSHVSRNLAAHVTALSALTEQVHDTHSTYVLKKLEPRLRCGLVRVAVIGITGSGKSTLVNALSEQLILPENPSISSPIPVWIGYQEGETSAVEIYRNEDGRMQVETCDILTFRKKYCYNLHDILDKDRTRYNNTEFGTVSVQADVLRNNITIIDTLGISANSVDSRKTIRVLEEGVDAVLFVTKNAQLNEEEIRFIYRYILGCSKDAECNTKPILPQNLLFVHNAFSGFPPKTAFSERVRTLFAQSGLGLEDGEIDNYVKNNIFYVNAFDARMGKLGAYPYSGSAPQGSREKELAALAKREAAEQKKLEQSSRETLIAQSGIDELRDAIGQLGLRLGQGSGEGNVSAKRIRDLLCIVDGIIRSANQRITVQNLTLQDLQDQKTKFSKLEESDIQQRQNIRSAFKELSRDYRDGFNRLMEAILDNTLRPVCVGYAERLSVPVKFREDYEQIVGMRAEARAQYLEKEILDGVIKAIYENCGNVLIRELDERQANDFKTPFTVIAETKKCMDDQAVILNGMIDTLKKSGGDALGMFFPQPLVVESLMHNLKLDLEEKIKGIIADACRLSGNNYISQNQNILQKCRTNLLQNVIGLFLPNMRSTMLWSQVRSQILVPLANGIVDDMPEYTVKQILEQTMEAFDASRDAICERHVELFVSLKLALKKLEEQIEQADQNISVTLDEMTELKASCERIRSDIEDILTALTDGGSV